MSCKEPILDFDNFTVFVSKIFQIVEFYMLLLFDVQEVVFVPTTDFYEFINNFPWTKWQNYIEHSAAPKY